MNEHKLGRKLCKLGEMLQQPVLLPQKLVLGNDTIKPKLSLVLICRGVPRPKIPRMGKAKNVYLREYSDPFLGKTNYCFKVLAPFQKPVPRTPLPIGASLRGVLRQ